MASNGLIDQFADPEGAKVPQVTGSGYQAASTTAAQTGAAKAADFAPGTATTGSVTEDQTVQGRIRGIVDENSPLQQQAATMAKQSANQRGLLNSSMAVTAGQDALYRSALPIAQQDADTYRQQAARNQDAQNQYGIANLQERSQTSRFNVSEANKGDQFNAGEANRVGLVNTEAANRAAEFGAQAGNTAQIQNQRALMEARDQQTRVQLQQMDADTRTNLANIEANFKTLMQASQSASDLYAETVRQISGLQNNRDLDAASRNALIAQQTELLQNGLNIIGSMNNLNLSELLDFSAVNAAGAGAANGSGAYGGYGLLGSGGSLVNQGIQPPLPPDLP